MNDKNLLHQRFMKAAEKLAEKLVKENKNIVAIIIGGSVVRGDENEHSDIDINIFMKEQDLPKMTRSFYLFDNIPIEQSFLSMDSIASEKPNVLILEAKMLYDPKNFIKKIQQENANTYENRLKIFKRNFENAKKRLEEAEALYKQQKYEESLAKLLGFDNFSYELIHSIPPFMDLPFPSFKTMIYLKKALESMGIGKIYYEFLDMYGIKNFDRKDSLNCFLKFEKLYNIVGECYKQVDPEMINFGWFFCDLKKEHNLSAFRRSIGFENEASSLRFMISMAVFWCFDEKHLWKNEKNKILRPAVVDLAKEIMKINEIDKPLIEDKLRHAKIIVEAISSSVNL